VDIFFVISGYVIADRLLVELRVTKNFDIKTFAIRRLLRLLPAMTVMLIFFSAVSFLFQTPFAPVGQQQVTAKTGLSGIFFLANEVIPRLSSGYFGASAKSNSMTHLWSTSIEAQFYLLFALSAFFAVTVIRKLWVLFALNILILVVTFYSNLNSLTSAFFSLNTRAWEIVLGVMLHIAFFYLSDKKVKLSKFVKLITILSLTFLIFSQIQTSNELPFLKTLSCLAGVIGLLFIIGNGQHTSAKKVLTFRPLVWIGNRSYSIYLYHWPIIVLVKSFSKNNYLALSFSIPLIFIISAVSFALVEKKFKYEVKNVSRNLKGLSFLVSASAIILLTLGIGAKHGWGSTEFGMQNGFKSQLSECPKMNIKIPNCYFESAGNSKTLVAVGDSQAETLIPPLLEIANEKKFNLLVISRAGDPVTDLRCPTTNGCEDEIMDLVQSINPEILVIANLWNLPKNSKDLENLEENFITPVAKDRQLQKKRIVLVNPLPIVPFFESYFTLANKLIFKKWTYSPIYTESQEKVFNAFQKAKNEFPNIKLVDPSDDPKTCKSCALLVNGNSRYRDASHLTSTGAFQSKKSFLKTLV